MKYILVFVLAFVFSFGGSSLYQHFLQKQVKKNSSVPQIVSAFSLQNAPKETLNATVTSLQGDILWQSRVATEPAKISVPQALQEGENIFTKKGTAAFAFKNAETIQMQSNTEVDIVQTLPVNIVLTQQSGVTTYTDMEAIPLSVHALSLLVNQKEKGIMIVTVNNVTDTVRIDVQSGSVQAGYTDTTDTSVVDTINAGQTYVYDDSSATGEVVE